MVNCVGIEFASRYYWVDKNFFDTRNPNAKLERDDIAKKLRTEGWNVKTKKSSVCGSYCYSIEAKKEKPMAVKVSDNTLDCPVCKAELTPYTPIAQPYGEIDNTEYGTCKEHGIFRYQVQKKEQEFVPVIPVYERGDL